MCYRCFVSRFLSLSSHSVDCVDLVLFRLVVMLCLVSNWRKRGGAYCWLAMISCDITLHVLFVFLLLVFVVHILGFLLFLGSFSAIEGSTEGRAVCWRCFMYSLTGDFALNVFSSRFSSYFLFLFFLLLADDHPFVLGQQLKEARKGVLFVGDDFMYGLIGDSSLIDAKSLLEPEMYASEMMDILYMMWWANWAVSRVEDWSKTDRATRGNITFCFSFWFWFAFVSGSWLVSPLISLMRFLFSSPPPLPISFAASQAGFVFFWDLRNLANTE